MHQVDAAETVTAEAPSSAAPDVSRFPVRDVPDNLTTFAFLARQTPYRQALRAMSEKHKSYRFIEMDLDPALLAALRSAVLDAIDKFGHAGWQRADGKASTYGGFSLAYNPNHRDNLDPNVSSLGTPQNTADRFFYNQRDRNRPLKDSYFDTYGFRRRTPASQHGALGTFLDQLQVPLIRSRVGIIYGSQVDPADENYLATAGWHRDEPVYENLRVNIPLQTDPNFVFQIEGEAPRHLEVGKAYSWDTHVPHRVYCQGKTTLDRVHLVLGTSPWFTYHADDDAWEPNASFGKVHPFELLMDGRIHPSLTGRASQARESAAGGPTP
ncbi:hypothetical protein ACQR1I_32775 [Bradyrhizobium sp. HKCCYLS2038]|uniref:hypothetical protein n=1 Tax=unclassified Bradyrhizobium TaxID=2631580 RepID=UPI003EBAB3E7